MNPLFEKYLLSEMSELERASLERELENNPDLLRAQFEQERELMETLQSVVLRRTIKTALAMQKKPETGVKSNVNWLLRAILAFAFFIVLGLVWNQFFKPSLIVPPEIKPPVQNQSKTEPSVVEHTNPQEDKNHEDIKDNKQNVEQLAQSDIKPHSLRGIRGNRNEHTPWTDLVIKIWYAPFPTTPTLFSERYKPAIECLNNNNFTDAFLLLRKVERQTSGNDTLAFLKGYCLMQMWEGEGALRSFDSLSGKPQPWAADVEWYRGLCYLLTGEKKKAITVFAAIAEQPNHPFIIQAERALKLLK